MPALSQHQRETLTNLMLNDKYADHHKQGECNCARCTLERILAGEAG